MTPEIITVHNIYDSIEDVGIQSYANRITQEMGGQYFYIEADLVDEKPESDQDLSKPVQFIKEIEVDMTDYTFEPGPDDPIIEKRWWKYRVWPIPLRLAWFLISALKLKSSAMNLGLNEYEELGKQAVYLTPGKILFGKKIEKITEVPAELMPVCVEKL